jgi:hypothetical protein
MARWNGLLVMIPGLVLWLGVAPAPLEHPALIVVPVVGV